MCPYKITTRLDWSTDLHAQSTVLEYVSFSHCQTYSRVLGVHPAETHLQPHRSTSSNSHIRTASRILQYHWAVSLLDGREGPMTVLQTTPIQMFRPKWTWCPCSRNCGGLTRALIRILFMLNTSLRIIIFRLPKEFCVHRPYWQRFDIAAIHKSAFIQHGRLQADVCLTGIYKDVIDHYKIIWGKVSGIVSIVIPYRLWLPTALASQITHSVKASTLDDVRTACVLLLQGT